MITEIVAPIITGVSVSLIVFFVTRYFASIQAKKAAEIERKESERLNTAKMNADKIDALTRLTKAMAQHKIVTIGNNMIAQKVVTTSEKAMLEDIYKAYHESPLYGNGLGETVMEVVEKLPVVADE